MTHLVAIVMALLELSSLPFSFAYPRGGSGGGGRPASSSGSSGSKPSTGGSTSAGRPVSGSKVPFSSASPKPGQIAQSRGPLGPFALGARGPSYGTSWGNLALIYTILELTDEDQKPSSTYSSVAENSTCFFPPNATSPLIIPVPTVIQPLNVSDFGLLVNHVAKIMNVQNNGFWDPKVPYFWDSGTDEPGDPRRALIEFFPRDNQTKAEKFPPGAMLRVAGTIVNSTCQNGYGGQAYLSGTTGWGVRVYNRLSGPAWT